MRSLLAFVLASAVSQLLGGAAHRQTEKGNAKYEAKAAPDAPELPYNLGNVAFRQDPDCPA